MRKAGPIRRAGLVPETDFCLRLHEVYSSRGCTLIPIIKLRNNLAEKIKRFPAIFTRITLYSLTVSALKSVLLYSVSVLYSSKISSKSFTISTVHLKGVVTALAAVFFLKLGFFNLLASAILNNENGEWKRAQACAVMILESQPCFQSSQIDYMTKSPHF